MKSIQEKERTVLKYLLDLFGIDKSSDEQTRIVFVVLIFLAGWFLTGFDILSVNLIPCTSILLQNVKCPLCHFCSNDIFCCKNINMNRIDPKIRER